MTKQEAGRRSYSKELKEEAVQMVLEGYSAPTVAENLGISSVSLIYRWKASSVKECGATAEALEQRVLDLEERLRRAERERDVLKKALAIFSRAT